jgi:PIN domain nuclease of toxin-antitoxin system
VNLVADTHALVWYLAGDHRRLSTAARRAFRDAEAGRTTVHIPMVALMEIALLEERGRLRLAYGDLREQLALRPGLPLEPVLPEDIDEARTLVQLRDPFDRLIAGTAVRLALPLLTNDARITASGRLRTFW